MVYLDAYWIGQTEVTNAQYQQCVAGGACDPAGCMNDDDLDKPDQPVVCVSWVDAKAFCEWAGLQLPTEAQWEWMARGAAGRRYPWGDEEPTPAHASYAFRIEHPTPVGIYPHGLTPEGVVDLAGNVWEWCADWYGSYPEQEQTDPAGPRKGNHRVLRGGAFGYHPDNLRAAYRYLYEPDYRDGYVGFRLVWLSPEDN